MIYATVTIGVSILATLGMQRLNLVEISRGRRGESARFEAGSRSWLILDGESEKDVAVVSQEDRDSPRLFRKKGSAEA